MNESVFQEALREIQSRRIRAEAENERRYAEINAKIPPIAEINAQLALTSTRIVEILRGGEDVQDRLEALRRQNEQGQQISARLLVENGYPADYLDMHYTCEKCQDTGYSGGSLCDCLRRRIAAAGIARMNRTAQLKLCDFSGFSLEYYKNRTSPDGEDCYTAMKKVFNGCLHYAETFSLASPSLLFYGSSGLGKTHLSLSIAKAVIDKGYDVIYDSVINLLGQVEKEHFGRGDADADTLSLLLEADLLILDDLGAEFTTPFYVSTVYNIINTRLNRGLPTIISTNLDIASIHQSYEERIVSRLFAVYECYHFIGADIRLLKKKSSPARF
ncbi:MAG: ATP-binding protein [Oscillospiraceae bacterium]|nr:ATP-binding protein [Oscillospiraceae bacterium]